MFCGLSRYNIYDCKEKEQILCWPQPARIMWVLYQVHICTTAIFNISNPLAMIITTFWVHTLNWGYFVRNRILQEMHDRSKSPNLYKDPLGQWACIAAELLVAVHYSSTVVSFSVFWLWEFRACAVCLKLLSISCCFPLQYFISLAKSSLATG